MERDENQEATSFMPFIPRLDRLDRVLSILEEKYSLPSRRGLCAAANNKDFKTLSSALEEVQNKGTLMERLTALENRVLELGLEIEEGNTSKSSSSTVTGKDSIPKEQDDNRVTVITSQEKQDPPTIKLADESASTSLDGSSDGFLKEITAQHQRRVQKKRARKSWLGLFRLTC